MARGTYMKCVDHASYSTIRKFIRDVLGESVSRGYLRKIVAKASAALDVPYAKLLERLPLEQVVNVTVQFCIAHLIRDIKYLTGLKDAETKAYGKKLLAAVKVMFKIIHDREHLAPEAFGEAMAKARETIIEVAISQAPSRRDDNGKELKREASNMAKRFRDNGKAYFEFILAAVRAYFQSQPAPSLLPATG